MLLHQHLQPGMEHGNGIKQRVDATAAPGQLLIFKVAAELANDLCKTSNTLSSKK